MNALSIALKVNVNVAYLDGHDAQGQVSFVPFQNASFTVIDTVNLLYRCVVVPTPATAAELSSGRGTEIGDLSGQDITTFSIGGTRIPWRGFLCDPVNNLCSNAFARRGSAARGRRWAVLLRCKLGCGEVATESHEVGSFFGVFGIVYRPRGSCAGSIMCS